MDPNQHSPDPRDRTRPNASEANSRSWLRYGIFPLHRSTARTRRARARSRSTSHVWRLDALARCASRDLGNQSFGSPPRLGKFDVVTAFLICFNRHKQRDVWGVPEWEFFLDDLAKHLTRRGRVWLELNQEYDGTFYTPELKQFFQKRGAKIDRHKVVF